MGQKTTRAAAQRTGQPAAHLPAPGTQRTTRNGRIANSLVALSAVAIASVFGVGYLHTRSSIDQLLAQAGAQSSSALAGQSAALPDLGSPTPLARGSAQSLPTPAPGTRATPTPQPQAQAGKYRDGTYVGVGSSRHGGMQVTVLVQGGQIQSAAITSCATRYPCSKVAPLVSEVVSKQSAPVNYVSGATDSSMAYRQAVTSALAKAV